MPKQFPENFWWGSATSGPQTEGAFFEDGKSATTWDDWFTKYPHRFFKENNVENNLYHRYPEYVQIAQKLFFNSLRTSIQWSRLLPDGKTLNQKAVDFYRNYFKALKAAKIRPFVCLFHFDNPLWIMQNGGWTNPQTVNDFVFYARTAFEQFGDLVEDWFTFNEPAVPIMAGYLHGLHPPAEISIKKALAVQHNTILAHAKTVNLFHKQKCKGSIGIILNISPPIPRSNQKPDVEAAEWAALFESKTFLECAVKGKYPPELINECRKRNILWHHTSQELEAIKNGANLDILGVNFYSVQRVMALPYTPNWDGVILPNTHYFNTYNKPGKRMNPYRGWEIYPKGVYQVLKDIQNNYGNIPVFVSENGMGVENEARFRNDDGKIIDNYRIDFLTEHLEQIHKAIREGANCLGYHMWTYVDNWSWTNAYKNRYGYIEYDLEKKQFKPKESASWIKKVIKNNALPD